MMHIGQAGVQIGESCLELLALEHGLAKDGAKINPSAQMTSGFYSFFEESSSGKFSPRSIFIDLDPMVIEDLKAGEYRHMIKSQYLIKGKEDAANNFARGRYTVGKDILDPTLDIFRRLAESCGSLQGFVLTHSIGGGCGSGFTSLLLEHISTEFGLKKNILDYCIFPSDASLCVVEPYNAVLSAPVLIEHTNVTFPFDNQTVGKSHSLKSLFFPFMNIDLFLLSSPKRKHLQKRTLSGAADIFESESSHRTSSLIRHCIHSFWWGIKCRFE